MDSEILLRAGCLRRRRLFALLATAVAAAGFAACGNAGRSGSDSPNLIEENPANSGKQIVVGSKNFSEEFILGEIYSQALKAAGYDVRTELNLGSELTTLKALRDGRISGYPEYTATALTSFFDVKPADVPEDAGQAVAESKNDFTRLGLTVFRPAPYESANAVGMLKSRADALGVSKLSDLEGKSPALTLYGPPECRRRADCLVGLQNAGLGFKEFAATKIGLRYEVLDTGKADASILFTSDGQLANSDKYVILEDDLNVFPPGNPVFISSTAVVRSAGPDLQKTIESVQSGLTLSAMQELNARVDLDREALAAVAADYLRGGGYIR